MFSACSLFVCYSFSSRLLAFRAMLIYWSGDLSALLADISGPLLTFSRTSSVAFAFAVLLV